MRQVITRVPHVLLRRFPHIVAYFVAAYALIVLGQMLFYRFMPAEHFLHYSKFQINTIEEHQDAPFEACKNTDFAYKVDGNRKIYRIPEGKSEIDKVLVKTYPLDSIISKAPCVNAFITKEQYDFTVGHYQVYTTFNFKTKYGNEKSVTFKSNIFTVIAAKPATVEDIQNKINELQMQIDALKAQLASLGRSGQDIPESSSSAPQTAQATQKPQSKTPDGQTNNPPPDSGDTSIVPVVTQPLVGCTALPVLGRTCL